MTSFYIQRFLFKDFYLKKSVSNFNFDQHKGNQPIYRTISAYLQHWSWTNSNK